MSAITNPVLIQLIFAADTAAAAQIFVDAAPQFEAAREAAEVLLEEMQGLEMDEARFFAQEVERLRASRRMVEAGTALAGISTFVGQNVSGAQWRNLQTTESWRRRAALFTDPASLREGVRATLAGPKPADLTQRAAELRELGVPFAEAVAQVEAKMGFKLNLDLRAIQARAAELAKLFGVVKLPIPPEYHRLPSNQQTALIKIGRAMQLLAIAHRMQNNPYAEVFEQLVMETPALAPLRPYYLRWAGVFDLARGELAQGDAHRYFGFLPGMEKVTRPPGGGMYPPEMTLAEFRGHVPENSQANEEMRVVFRYDGKGQLMAVPYAKAYATWLEPAAKLLKEAAQLLEVNEPAIASYLRLTAKAYRDNSFTAVDEAWIGLQSGTLDMDLAPVEQPADGLRHVLAQFAGVIQIIDPTAAEELSWLKDLFPDLEEELPVAKAYQLPPAQRKPPPVSSVINLYATGEGTDGSYLARAYNRPNDEKVRRAVGNRIVLMANVGEARDETPPQARRLTQLAIHPRFRHLVTTRGGEWFVRLHELAHRHGVEYLVRDPQTTSRSALGKIYGSTEELKADMTGIHNARVLTNMGKIPSWLVHEIYVSYVHWCLGKLRRDWTEDHARGNLVALNFLQDRGAIIINPDTGVIDFDFKRYAAAVSELSGLLITIKGDGDKTKAEALYAQYGSTLPKGVEHLFEAMKDMPIDVIVTYEFERLLGDHPQ